MKTLNLDELAKVQATVTIGGKEHEIKELSVEAFIEASAEAKRMKDMNETDIAADIDATVKHLHRIIPSLPESEIRALNMAQLHMLLAFVNGGIADEEKKGADVSGN